MDWFTSDLHYDHQMALKTRDFNSMQEMNQALVDMFDVVNKGDIVYILGDVSWSEEGARRIFDKILFEKKASKLVIIEGNHDKNWVGKVYLHPRIELCQTRTLKEQASNGYKAVFLSHYPHIIYDKSHYGSYQLHGHGHAQTSDRPLLDSLIMGKRLNVNCELHDFKLWSRDEVEAYMDSMPKNIDSYLCKGTDEQKEKVNKMLVKIHNILKELNNL